MAFSEEQLEKLNDSLATISRASELGLGIQQRMLQQNEHLISMGGKLSTKGQTRDRKADSFGTNVTRQLTSVVTGIYIVGKAVMDMARRMETLQKESLSRGFSLQRVAEKYATTTEALDSHLTGYGNALEVVSSQLQVGLVKSSTEITKLGVFTKVTGGQQKAVFKQLVKNTQGLGVTTKEMAVLAETTMGLSQQYGLTTTELVNAVGKLSDELVNFGALGIGAEMNEASMRLAAALGPSMAELGPQLLGSLTKGSSMIQAQLLGVTKQREAILRKEGDMNRNAFDLILTASKNAEKITNQWTKGAKDPAFMLHLATKLYGKEVAQLMQVRRRMVELAAAQGKSVEAYVKGVQRQHKISEEFRATWSNFKERVLSPFQKLFEWFGKIAYKLMDMPWVAEIASVLVGLTAILTAAVSLSKLNNSLLMKQITQGYQTMVAITANTRAMLGASASNAWARLPLTKKGQRIGWQMGAAKTPLGIGASIPRKGAKGLLDKAGGMFGWAAKGRGPMQPATGILSKLLPVTRVLGHAITKLTGPIGWLITALLLLGPGIIKGFKEAWDYLWGILKPVTDLFVKGWGALKKSFGAVKKEFKWLGHILNGTGRIIGAIIGGVLVAALLVLAAPLVILGGVLWAVIQALKWVGNKFQEQWDKLPAWMGGGGGGEEEGISTYAEGPTLRVSVEREPINIQELRQAAHAETVLRNKQTQDQLAAMNTKLSETLAEAKEQRDTLEVANEQRETANAQRAQGQSTPETRPRDRNGRSPG
jgi:hypothetical protein